MQKIVAYDTTLRDGTQGGGFNLTVDDKLRMTRELDRLRFDYIEGGWPGSNPKDIEFFRRAKGMNFGYARLAAFGSTRYKNTQPENDANLQLLVDAGTPVVTIFGKTSETHVRESLETTLDENLRMISDSVAYLKRNEREVVYDAEHFFDGFKLNKGYALATIQEAQQAGADWIVLCDTNGGMDFDDVREIIRETKSMFPTARFGIHTHDDIDYGTANAMVAVKEGFEMVQGTVNGYGERIGNGDLITILMNARKKGYSTEGGIDITQFYPFYRWVCDVANVNPNPKQHYVGKDAFAHKGGIHVSAVLKNPALYEHIDPSIVGNQRRFYVSELSGASNIEAVLGIDRKDPLARDIVDIVKVRESQGYSYEDARGSLDLLVERARGKKTHIFELLEHRIEVVKVVGPDGMNYAKAVLKVKANGDVVEKEAYGDGPVNALDLALRYALTSKYPELTDLELTDFKMRVLPGDKRGTASRVRVFIESRLGQNTFGTVGVGENSIEASWEALVDSYEYAHFLRNGRS